LFTLAEEVKDTNRIQVVQLSADPKPYVGVGDTDGDCLLKEGVWKNLETKERITGIWGRQGAQWLCLLS
jgi:hypothetical protein